VILVVDDQGRAPPASMASSRRGRRQLASQTLARVLSWPFHTGDSGSQNPRLLLTIALWQLALDDASVRHHDRAIGVLDGVHKRCVTIEVVLSCMSFCKSFCSRRSDSLSSAEVAPSWIRVGVSLLHGPGNGQALTLHPEPVVGQPSGNVHAAAFTPQTLGIASGSDVKSGSSRCTISAFFRPLPLCRCT
jgi:hypothetical protein